MPVLSPAAVTSNVRLMDDAVIVRVLPPPTASDITSGAGISAGKGVAWKAGLLLPGATLFRSR